MHREISRIEPAVAITRVTVAHRAALVAAANHPAVSLASSVPHPCPPDFFDGLIAGWDHAEPTTLTFAVLVDGVALGATTLKRIDRAQRSADLSFWLTPAHWGKGITLQAARATLREGVRKLGLTTAHAHCLPEHNPASLAVLRKLGFEDDPARADLPVEGRFAAAFPGEVWRFFVWRVGGC
jgi:RimJ/RimL family protein N-acetyltransferase